MRSWQPWSRRVEREASGGDRIVGATSQTGSRVKPGMTTASNRHFFQNAGVSSTSSVKSSRRPSSMVSVHTQVWKSFSTA
jgi:hypothetical protein